LYTDIFWYATYEQHYLFTTPDVLNRLPSSLVAAFDPALPFVVAPLIAREQVIGFVILDNKFTRSPITPDDIEQLLTFAGTAALVIDNARLLQDMRTEQEKLRSLSRTSDALLSPRQPRRVLQDIVEQTRAAAKASSASLLLIDEASRVRDMIAAGIDIHNNPRSVIRPNGISVQVLDTGRPVIIEDVSRQPERVNPSMFERGIAAALCLPLSLPLQGKRVGVVWIHYRRARRFSNIEVEALQLYVNQAAIAYDNARRVKELEHMRQAIEALSSAAGLHEVHEQIVRTAQVVLRADSAVIWSYNAVWERFVLEDSVAAGIAAEIWDAFRQQAPLRGGTAYTVMEQGWVGVEDIGDVERYAFIGEETRGLLRRIGARSFHGVALVVGDECLGILYANYNHPRHFTEEDQRDLKSLAAQAAVATQNARRFEDLKRIKGYIGSQTAVDWIRMVSTAWGHGIRREVGTALGRVALLRGLLDRHASPHEFQSELDQLDGLIRGIKEIPITAPLSYEDVVDSVKINDLVKTYLDRQWKLARYNPVHLAYDLQPDLDYSATIRASREWLRQAIEILVDNAVQAMLDAGSPRKQLQVTTRQVGAKVEISIADTGPGISDTIVAKIFREPIEKPVGSRGAGIGLMLAHTIIQAYAGDISIVSSDASGTSIAIVLPIEHQTA
jgi:GAF domain-containing protein